MLTYRERYPEEFIDQAENDKQNELELKRYLHLSHAHDAIKSELNAISFIDRERVKENRPKPQLPNTIPSKTGASYEEWRKRTELKRSLNKATTCLEMRISMKGNENTKRLYQCKPKQQEKGRK